MTTYALRLIANWNVIVLIPTLLLAHIYPNSGVAIGIILSLWLFILIHRHDYFEPFVFIAAYLLQFVFILGMVYIVVHAPPFAFVMFCAYALWRFSSNGQ